MPLSLLCYIGGCVVFSGALFAECLLAHSGSVKENFCRAVSARIHPLLLSLSHIWPSIFPLFLSAIIPNYTMNRFQLCYSCSLHTALFVQLGFKFGYFPRILFEPIKQADNFHFAIVASQQHTHTHSPWELRGHKTPAIVSCVSWNCFILIDRHTRWATNTKRFHSSTYSNFGRLREQWSLAWLLKTHTIDWISSSAQRHGFGNKWPQLLSIER